MSWVRALGTAAALRMVGLWLLLAPIWVSQPAWAQVRGFDELAQTIEEKVNAGKEGDLLMIQFAIQIAPPKRSDFGVQLTLEPADAFYPSTIVLDPPNTSWVTRIIRVVDTDALIFDNGVIRTAVPIDVVTSYGARYTPTPTGSWTNDCILTADFYRSNGERVRLDSPSYDYTFSSNVSWIQPIQQGNRVVYERGYGDSVPATITMQVHPRGQRSVVLLEVTAQAATCGSLRPEVSLDVGLPAGLAVLFPVVSRYDPRDPWGKSQLMAGPAIMVGSGIDLPPSNPPRFPVPITVAGIVDGGGFRHRVRLMLGAGVEAGDGLLVGNSALTYRLRLTGPNWPSLRSYTPPGTATRSTPPGAEAWLYFGATGGIRTFEGTIRPHVGPAAGLSFTFKSAPGARAIPVSPPR